MSKAERAAPAELFAALGDPTRLSLVMKLAAGRACSIATLSRGAEVTRQAMTKHLRVLERAGLVRSEHAGRETRFRLEPEAIGPARAYLDDVSAQWEEALGRLKAFVER
jgi:DNA-binding transcriptional ArsR family regulator